jgi:tetratricopeptide (TPR) repeat protein
MEFQTSQEKIKDSFNKRLKQDLKLDEIEERINTVREYRLFEIEAEAYIVKADKLYKQGLYKEAFVAYYSALDIYNNVNDNSKRAFLYNKLGKCKGVTVEYLEALKYFEKSYVIALECNDISTIKNALFNIAICNKNLNNLSIALKAVNELIGLIDKVSNFDDYIDAVITKANCFLRSKEYDEAINLYNEVIPLFKDAAHYLLGYIYHNLGLNYLEKGLLESALESFNRAITIRELSHPEKLSHTELEKAKVFHKFNMSEKAIAIANRAIETAEKHNEIRYILEGYYLLENIYSKMNRLDLLQKVYVKLLEILEKAGKKEDMMKIYIKLSLLDAENNDKYMKRLQELVSI